MAKKRKNPYLPFLFPIVIYIMALTLYPTIYALYLSVVKAGATSVWSFIGFKNYLDVIQDKLFWNSVQITFYFVIVTIIVEFLLGIGLALLLNREIRGMRLFRTVILIPIVMTPVVTGVTWKILYHSRFGFINYLLSIVGLPKPDWLGDP